MTESAPDIGRLVSNIEWALDKGLPASELVPMLRGLHRQARPASPEAIFAIRKLAELLMSSEPWEAAKLSDQLIKVAPDERAFGLYGLSQTLLGNYKMALKAYRKALAMAPDFVACSHNLGHLLDVACNRPRDALSYLKRAHLACPEEPEIASSYAHALARTGDLKEAQRLLEKALPSRIEEIDDLIRGWLAEDAETAGRMTNLSDN